MQWIMYALLAALAAYLLERLTRLLSGNRSMQMGPVNILRRQIQQLEEACNKEGLTAVEARGIRTRMKTLMNEYGALIDQINDIENRKAGVFTAFKNMWQQGTKVALNA